MKFYGHAENKLDNKMKRLTKLNQRNENWSQVTKVGVCEGGNGYLLQFAKRRREKKRIKNLNFSFKQIKS